MTLSKHTSRSRLCRKEGENKRGRKEGALKPPSKLKKEGAFKIIKKRGRKEGEGGKFFLKATSFFSVPKYKLKKGLLKMKKK